MLSRRQGCLSRPGSSRPLDPAARYLCAPSFLRHNSSKSALLQCGAGVHSPVKLHLHAWLALDALPSVAQGIQELTCFSCFPDLCFLLLLELQAVLTLQSVPALTVSTVSLCSTCQLSPGQPEECRAGPVDPEATSAALSGAAAGAGTEQRCTAGKSFLLSLLSCALCGSRVPGL